MVRSDESDKSKSDYSVKQISAGLKPDCSKCVLLFCIAPIANLISSPSTLIMLSIQKIHIDKICRQFS